MWIPFHLVLWRLLSVSALCALALVGSIAGAVEPERLMFISDFESKLSEPNGRVVPGEKKSTPSNLRSFRAALAGP
jgi:hypothetical protein